MKTEDVNVAIPETSTVEESKPISIQLPTIKLPSLQAGMLILLIAVGVLQTAQLYNLNTRILSGQVNSAPAAITPSSVTSGNSVTSSLPNMVGGC